MPFQSFLPILDIRTKTLKGMVPITSTDFVGTETTFNIGGTVYPIIQYQPVVSRPTKQPWYMAVDMTYLQFKQEAYRGIPGYIPVEDMLPGQWWQMSSIGPEKRDVLGALIDGLLFGFGTNLSITVTPAPTVNPSGGTFVWSAAVPFANQPQVTFTDINWVEAVQVLNTEGSPLFLTVDSVTTGAAAAQNKLRAMVVISGQPALNRATYNTIRVVRMPGQVVLEGETFIINGTVRGQDGYTAAVAINLTIA